MTFNKASKEEFLTKFDIHLSWIKLAITYQNKQITELEGSNEKIFELSL